MPPDEAPMPTAGGELNAEGPIWRGAAFYSDGWSKAVDGEPLPDTPVIISKGRWLAERDQLAGRNAPLGLTIEPADSLDDIAADLPRFALVLLSFPKFADGRAFSLAMLLRDKHGFAGELRAVGNVLSDQIPYMRRCGFNSYEVAHAPTRRALVEGRIPEVTLFYQPAAAREAPAGTRPWLRRG
jgi:phosphoadenosine phosphosulfate reductase